MIDLAARAYIYGVSVRRHIGWLRCLELVIELVGGERLHEVHGSGQGHCLAIIQPSITILCFSFEITSALDEPRCIVSRHLRRFGIKTSKFPVRACLLQDKS